MTPTTTAAVVARKRAYPVSDTVDLNPFGIVKAACADHKVRSLVSVTHSDQAAVRQSVMNHAAHRTRWFSGRQGMRDLPWPAVFDQLPREHLLEVTCISETAFDLPDLDLNFIGGNAHA